MAESNVEAELAALRQELEALKQQRKDDLQTVRLRAGQQEGRIRKRHVPSHMQQPLYGRGDTVKLTEGSSKNKRGRKDANKAITYEDSPLKGATGVVQDLPATEHEGFWKYKVNFPGIGTDGCLERELEPA